MNVWKKNEIEFLKEKYPNNGLLYCVDNLEKNKDQIKSKVVRLGLKRISDLKYNRENFTETVLKSINLVDVCRNIGISLNYGNRQTIKKYIDLYDINIDHFYIPLSSGNKKMTIDEILVKDSKYTGTTNLKNKLYKLNIKNRKCELCGQGEEWLGRKISLILDHINGFNNDNRIDNLRIVCPNCNASLDTHCKGYRGILLEKCKVDKIIQQSDKKYNVITSIKKKVKVLNFCECGKKIEPKSKKCTKCDQLKQRIVERPSYEILLKEVEDLGYSGTGRKYGVSDNSIRKWIKNYRLIA
jgi:hypothetical protein